MKGLIDKVFSQISLLALTATMLAPFACAHMKSFLHSQPIREDLAVEIAFTFFGLFIVFLFFDRILHTEDNIAE